MIGVAVGLGNVWRFPYMTGRYGGAAFVLLYVVVITVVGVPALMAEWTLGRHTRRGPVGAYAQAGLPAGRLVGWLLFGVVAAATGYYTNVVGWVAWHAVAPALDSSARAILPPASGVDADSMRLQLLWTGGLLLVAAFVLRQGLRRGVERASRILTPLLFVALIVVAVRALTLPGAGAGLAWYLGGAGGGRLTADAALAALGHAVFSLALGGTFMVVYGSYLAREQALGRNAVLTVAGDTTAGLLAGIAIFPAVFAAGLEPASGPTLLFETLPEVFAAMPAGPIVGTCFYAGLAGVAFLSVTGALEVLVAGVTDNTGCSRGRAVALVTGGVLILALPPMVNLDIFVPWDLTFGSGMQTFGAFAAAITVGWALDRGAAIRELGHPVLYFWLRWVIPLAVAGVGVWWAATELFA